MNFELAFRLANRNQIEAGTKYLDSSLAIIAAPGSGKTTTLCLRIAFLLNQNVDPKHIFAVTFTKKAASEMKKRLLSLIQPHINIEDITLGTFHHCALNILRANARRAGLSFDFSIISRKKQKQVLEEVLLNYLKNNKFEDLVQKHVKPLTEEQLQGILDEIDTGEPRGSCTSLPTGSLSYIYALICTVKINKQALKHLSRKFFEIFDAYNQKLHNNNQIDLPDILFMTTNLLEKYPELLQTYQSRFKYLIVDEFQDTNQIQLEFISLIGKKSFITVCGDEDQAIYGWRGATNEVFKEFRVLFPDTATVLLSQNYRSTQNIVKYSQVLIEKNLKRDPKSSFSNGEIGCLPEIIVTESSRQEAIIVVKMIKNYLKAGYQYKDIAILYRLHRVANEFVSELEKEKIPARTKSKPMVFDKIDTGLIYYLRVISDSKDEEAFMQILNWPKRGLGDSSKLRLRNTASLKSFSLIQALDYLAVHQSGHSTKGFLDLHTLLKYFKENLHLLTPSQILFKLITRFNLEKTPQILKISEQFLLPGKENLDFFLEAVNCSKDPNVISLSSIHQAKGQEWNIVFLVRVNEGTLPAGDDIEEERRLAYVAVTRAKKILIVSCAMSGSKGEITLPSRFVDELFEANLKSKRNEVGSIKKLKLE